MKREKLKSWLLKHLFKPLRYLIYIAMILLFLLSILFFLAQTEWAKEKIKTKILSFMHHQNIQIDIDKIEGSPPFAWEIQKITIDTQEDIHLVLEHLKFRIAILPLLKGVFAINYLNAEKATLLMPTSFSSPVSLDEARKKIASWLLAFSLDTPLIIDRFNIHECNTPFLSFAVQGKLKIGSKKQTFFSTLVLSSLSEKKNFFDLLIDANQFQNRATFHLETNLAAIPSLVEHLNGQAHLKLAINGAWSTWQGLIFDQPFTSPPLKGRIKVDVNHLAIPAHPLFLVNNEMWKGQAHFLIQDPYAIQVQNCVLFTPLVQLKGKGIVRSDLKMSEALATLVVSDLSSLIAYPEIKGKLQAKLFYKDSQLKSSFSTEHLSIAHVEMESIQGLIKAKKEGREYKGDLILSAKAGTIPFEQNLQFTYLPNESLFIPQCLIEAEGTTIQSYLSFDLNTLFTKVIFDANIANLDPFSKLFKKEEIEASLSLHVESEGILKDQNTSFSLSANHIRYNDTLIDQLLLSGQFSSDELYPEGNVHLTVEDIYSPEGYIEKLLFSMASDQENWPFSLHMNGQLDHPFFFDMKAIAQKETSSFSLECTEFKGEAACLPFFLKYPALFEWDLTSMQLSPVDFQVGQGTFYTTFSLSPSHSVGTWQFHHFPLEILNIFYPKFKLEGTLSSDGYIDATQEAITGKLYAAVEEASLLQQENKEPFQIKGTIQAHLQDQTIQICTHLQAVDSQFLDLQATLPINYELYPFSLKLEQNSPISAECLAEGKLEDLFDLINFGTHRMTGLVSTRLFLSHTLENPFLIGSIDWQHGTYENYFTGITLRDIHATFEANQNTLYLLSLKATDEETGTLEAQGKIQLDPKEHFPFAFTLEQKDLHILKFNMIDCHVTGPLYMTGNQLSATARGNLLVNRAKILLDEKLPYDVPTLPFTFIHRPPQLFSKTHSSPSPFLFHLDLELTAEDQVYVEGRGLNAELQGQVHVTGTNANVTANGALQLMKGEYQFSGKIFKLTEGEIVFKDKPNSSAYLQLNGTLSLPSVTITALLQGPLSHPQLFFQSNPQLSTSSILALILFNKEISAISHPEAIQLASVLMSLSGGSGPDVLETIRKSIGIDRLNITSASSDSDEIVVQIGKYLTRGILVTLAQSATSTQVIVEVELPKGFVFQAETQEQQEGKFSLKWTHSY